MHLTKPILLSSLLLLPSLKSQDFQLPSPEDISSALETLQSQIPESLQQQIQQQALDALAQFHATLQTETTTPELLASLRPQARLLLAQLSTNPDLQPYADWLAARIDYLDLAAEALAQYQQQQQPTTTPATPQPSAPPPTAPAVHMRNLAIWQKRLANNPLPPRAAELAPLVQKIFTADGIPSQLIWLAEVESSWNPDAKSPVGARGLFQFMPRTAQSLGLSLSPFDQRSNPSKSANAAARYLRHLYQRFNDWPLALAAYNAGETRVAKLLSQHHAQQKTFDAIAPKLPLETQMYVPKILATIQHRLGTSTLPIPPPTTPSSK